MRKKKKLR